MMPVVAQYSGHSYQCGNGMMPVVVWYTVQWSQLPVVEWYAASSCMVHSTVVTVTSGGNGIFSGTVWYTVQWSQ